VIGSILSVLVVIGLLGVMLAGSTLSTTSIQPVYSSSTQETSDEDQRDEPSNGGEPSNEGSADEAETEPVGEPVDDTNAEPLDESLTEQEQQEQLSLDIINANGLVLLNDTSGVDGNGDNDGGGGGPSTTSKEITCVGNSQGQTFCYERLPTEENCLKPINVEDPPLCLRPS
jgi:hypothetical protein